MTMVDGINMRHIISTKIIGGAAQKRIAVPITMGMTVRIVNRGTKYWRFLLRLPLKKLRGRGMTRYRRIILTEWRIWIWNLGYSQINERRN